MKIFNPTNSEFVAPVDLNILSDTYNTLETSHKEALKATSALKQTIAQYDLNEDENGWRAGKIAEVQSILNNNTVDGMSAFAVDDLIKASGDILFGADMQGRLKRQAAWKANNEKIDKMNMSEDYKRIFKQLNPYGTYQDKVDKNGNIIEGEAWKPTVNPVNTVALSDIMKTALAFAAKEAGSINNVSFLDKDGKPTSDVNQSATGEIYQQVNGTWQRLSKEKLSAAMEAAIASIPGAKESLKQDYDIAKWKYENGESSDIVGNDSRILSQDEYLASRIDPFYKAATFYNVSQTVKYGDAVKAHLLLNKQNVAGGNAASGKGLSDIPSGHSNVITVPNTFSVDAQASINKCNQLLSDTFTALGIKDDVTKYTDNQIIDILNKNNVNPNLKHTILTALSERKNNTEFLESVKASKGKQEKWAIDAYNTINSLGVISKDTDNPYLQEYAAISRGLYADADAIRQNFSDTDSLNMFIELMGGRQSLNKLGISIGTIDGKPYVELPKDFDKNLNQFALSARKAYSDTHNFFGEGWQNVKNILNKNWGDSIVRVYSDGSTKPITVAAGGDTKIRSSQPDIVFSRLNSFINNLQHDFNKSIGNDGKITLSTEVIGEASPGTAELSFLMDADPANAAHYKAAKDNRENQLKDLIKSIDLVQQGAFVASDETNNFEKISTADRITLTQLLKNANNNDITIGTTTDTNGNFAPIVTIKGKTNEKGEITSKPYTFIIPNIDSNYYEIWNRDTANKAKNDIKRSEASGTPLSVIDYTFNLPDTMTLIPNGEGFDVKVNGEVTSHINSETALRYRDIYHRYIDTKTSIMTHGSQLSQEAIENMYKNIAKSIASLYGGGAEVEAYILQNLIK